MRAVLAVPVSCSWVTFALLSVVVRILPAMISLSLGSRLTVQGRKVRMSLAVRTGVRDDRKTSKLRTSPSISSRGSTSLVVGMFFDTLTEKTQEVCCWWNTTPPFEVRVRQAVIRLINRKKFLSGSLFNILMKRCQQMQIKKGTNDSIKLDKRNERLQPERNLWPFVDGLERGLVGDSVGLLQVQDKPGCPVRPLLRQVDPRCESVPVKTDLIGAQQTTCSTE